MTATPRILLVDDGELQEVAEMLERLGIAFERLRGGLVGDDVAPPTDLLIATPRRAGTVRRGSPAGAPAGRPLRIIAVEEDSNAMRRMLRRMGFQLLVRRGAHVDVWRLLVERALFEGRERRDDERVPVGSDIALGHDSEEAASGEAAILVDISNRGCRVRTRRELEIGARLCLALPLGERGEDPLRLSGHVVRIHSDRDSSGQCSIGVLFDADLPEQSRLGLGRLLNNLSIGPGSLAPPTGNPLPPCESPVIPGLTLDDETDPAVSAEVECDLETPSQESGNRRVNTRGSFAQQVVALSHVDDEPLTHVMMGRDLSAGGMRIDPMPDVRVGDSFQLALYGPGQEHPFLVNAIVKRDDGPHGVALRFVDVSEGLAEGLEKLVACLPDIESLEAGEASALGAVISEILSRTPVEVDH